MFNIFLFLFFFVCNGSAEFFSSKSDATRLEKLGPKFMGPLAILRNWTYCLFYMMASAKASVTSATPSPSLSTNSGLATARRKDGLSSSGGAMNTVSTKAVASAVTVNVVEPAAPTNALK